MINGQSLQDNKKLFRLCRNLPHNTSFSGNRIKCRYLSNWQAWVRPATGKSNLVIQTLLWATPGFSDLYPNSLPVLRALPTARAWHHLLLLCLLLTFTQSTPPSAPSAKTPYTHNEHRRVSSPDTKLWEGTSSFKRAASIRNYLICLWAAYLPKVLWFCIYLAILSRTYPQL